MRVSSPYLDCRSTRWKKGSPVDGGHLRVEREWSRMRLVLVPDSLAIRQNFQVEQNAEYEYKKPCEQGQESEDDNCSPVMLLAFSEWID